MHLYTHWWSLDPTPTRSSGRYSEVSSKRYRPFRAFSFAQQLILRQLVMDLHQFGNTNHNCIWILFGNREIWNQWPVADSKKRIKLFKIYKILNWCVNVCLQNIAFKNLYYLKKTILPPRKLAVTRFGQKWKLLSFYHWAIYFWAPKYVVAATGLPGRRKVDRKVHFFGQKQIKRHRRIVDEFWAGKGR